MSLLDFLAAQIVSAAAFAAIVSWVGALTSKRIIHAWERKHQRDGDVLRGELARMQTVLGGAMQTFSAGHQAAAARRLQAAEEMWALVLKIWQFGSMAHFAYRWPMRELFLQDAEWRPLLKGPPNDAGLQFLQSALTKNDENQPFMGEEFHTLFVTYTTLVMGMVKQIRDAESAGTFGSFKSREWIEFMPADTLAAVGVTEHMDDAEAATALKARLGRIVASIISGERSATQSFEHAGEITRALQALDSLPPVGGMPRNVPPAR